MKNVFVVLFVLCFLNISQANAYNLHEFSKDTKIIQAMQLLENSGEYKVFDNLKKNAVKISFKDLTLMGFGSNVYAVNTYNEFGRRVIMINAVYKNAPAEQIACLIAHESYHIKNIADLEEETMATTKEADCWIKLKSTSFAYPETKLTKRLNKLANLQNTSDNENIIRNKIANSSFYMAQFGT